MDQHRQPTSPAPRSGSRSFSFRSDKSGGSTGKSKIVESPGEKERRDSIWRGESKANPNAAMIEAQPGEINLLEKATIEPLRNIQHKDLRGNVITDPDLSNPTRPRMERPLDTIRSFEKAIDSGYKRRTMLRGESYNDQNSQFASRRSSYIGGPETGRQSQGGYYGNRHSEQFSQPRRYAPRMQSDPAVSRSTQGGYQNAYQQHDTMQSAMTNASDSTGPWANSTDPSSENSSVERMYANNKGWGNDAIAEERGPNNGYTNAYAGVSAYHQAAPDAQRRPIPLSDMSPPVPKKALPPVPRPAPERRKSRLSRLFSKKE